MGAQITRHEFPRIFAGAQQGLFIFENDKRIPKDLPVLHMGRLVSDRLCAMQPEERRYRIDGVLQDIISAHAAVHMTHIQVLFAPTLGVNALAALLSLCRNKKICLSWPGVIRDGRLIYSAPDQPDYYNADFSAMIDTYIIPE